MFNLSETVLIIDRHLTRSFTVSFQLCRIFPVFKKLLQLSLKRSLGRPIGRDPSASSPYSNRLQVLLSSIRETCPSHRKRLCASRTSMSTTSDRASTSSLDTKSNQRIFKIYIYTYIYIHIYAPVFRNVFILKYIYIWEKKTNKLQVHPYKPVSCSPTHQGI